MASPNDYTIQYGPNAGASIHRITCYYYCAHKRTHSAPKLPGEFCDLCIYTEKPSYV